MSSSLTILPNQEIDPRGRRYDASDKATAYILWRTVCGRSARKVGERLGISDETIRRWAIDDNWPARADIEDQDDYGASRIATAALVVNQIVPSIETAIEIRDNQQNNPKDRLAAAQWLSGLAGVSPVSKIEQAVISQPKATEVIDVPSLTGMSPDELMRLEQQTREKQRG